MKNFLPIFPDKNAVEISDVVPRPDSKHPNSLKEDSAFIY
jgi:hypothetical protein